MGDTVDIWRCDITGNPVGTDTRMVGCTCKCQGCKAGAEIERLLAALKDARNCIFDCAADWPKASETALEKIDAALAFQQSTMGKSDAKG